MSNQNKDEAVTEIVDCLEQLIQRRMSNCKETRQESLQAISDYLLQTKEQ